jgi:hypothetical protein
MQLKDYHHTDIVLPPETLNAHPPTTNWPLGRYDTVLASTDPAMVWPQCGILGENFLLFLFDVD